MIEIRGLTFAYNGNGPVLRDVNLSIGRGDVLGVLGPNGSGKSTLLRLISGTLSPQRGEVMLEGKKVGSMRRREIARRLAVVPQETDLGFDYTVREVVSMGRYPHIGRFQFNDPRSARIVDRVMGITGVLEMADKPISRLSGGEKQRTIIARALAQEPDILLLDEPTKNLDVRHSLDILAMVLKMNRESGLTVVSVLHDLDLAARFCDRVALLKEGRLHGAGRTEDILKPSTIEEVFHVKARVALGDRIRVEILG